MGPMGILAVNQPLSCFFAEVCSARNFENCCAPGLHLGKPCLSVLSCLKIAVPSMYKLYNHHFPYEILPCVFLNPMLDVQSGPKSYVHRNNYETCSLQPWRCSASEFRQVVVTTPINVFARGGAGFLSLVKISWCYYPNQHICKRGCRIFIPY